MKHWYCKEMVTGEEFLVIAETWEQAYDIAKGVGADFSCGCVVYVDPEPLTGDEIEALRLDEYYS